MTEAEARFKWCPFVRQENFSIEGKNAWSTNRGESAVEPDDTISSGCIASDCMAWRATIADDELASAPDTGYCGLAGKP